MHTVSDGCTNSSVFCGPLLFIARLSCGVVLEADARVSRQKIRSGFVRRGKAHSRADEGIEAHSGRRCVAGCADRAVWSVRYDTFERGGAAPHGGRQLLHLRVDRSTLDDLAANGQLIQADGGRVIMTAGAQNALLASVVNNTGIVQARSVENHDGTITLLAGMAACQVKVGGVLDATAPVGEPGGSIETSGASVSVASTAKIVAGPGGSWRIDPTDLTIDAAAATAIDNSLNTGTSVTETTMATTASGLGTQSAAAGDINVIAAIAWTSPAASLTLTAYNAINVNATVKGRARS